MVVIIDKIVVYPTLAVAGMLFAAVICEKKKTAPKPRQNLPANDPYQIYRSAIKSPPEIDYHHEDCDKYNRRKVPLSHIMIHYTAGNSCEGAIDHLCNAKKKVSAHYVISKSGKITQLIDDQYRAWHAGKGNYEGITDMNGRSIGIEIVNEGGADTYNKAQIYAVISLCAQLMRDYQIPLENIIGHSDYAPGRKVDPGPNFPWKLVRAVLDPVDRKISAEY